MTDETCRDPSHWMYIGFAGETGFLGGAFVHVHPDFPLVGLTRAAVLTPDDCIAFDMVPITRLPPNKYLDRLLTRQRYRRPDEHGDVVGEDPIVYH